MEAGPVFGCLSVMLAFAAACSLSVALTAEVASDRKRAAAAQLRPVAVPVGNRGSVVCATASGSAFPSRGSSSRRAS